MADIVFILGAGCSVHAGAPVMAEFLDRSSDLRRAGKVEDKRAEFELVERAIGALQAVHSKCQLDIVNVESVLSAVDTGRMLKVFPGFAADEIEGLFDALQWVIVRTLEASMEFPTRGGAILPSGDYENFAKVVGNILERAPRQSVALITFNYDIGLDVALAFARLRANYGLAAGGEGVPLLKLHGSINWTRQADTQAITAIEMPEYLNRFRVRFPPEVGAKISVPISTQLVKYFSDKGIAVDGRPVIVPPTLNKSEYQRVLSPVWERAAKELQGAERIYILGYSLPDTDQFFRLLFGLGTASNVPLRDFAVMNPDSSVEKRVRDILGPTALARFRFNQLVFSQACNNLLGLFPSPRN